MALLKITEEESQLLLTYIKDTNLPGGLDRAKFLIAVSVLYQDPQNALEPVARKIAKTVVEILLLLFSVVPYDDSPLLDEDNKSPVV